MLIVYNYDAITKEYLSSEQAFVDERASEIRGETVYLIPNNATEIVPPKEKKGYARCFDINNNVWNHLEDHRGQVCYSKVDLSPVTINSLGPIPKTVFQSIPEPENEYQIWKDGQYTYPELSVLKSQIKWDLDKKYEQKMKQPYAINRFFVLPEWANIYTNTLVAMQQDIEQDGHLDGDYYVLLMTNTVEQKFEQIKIRDINEFLPLYNKVKAVYKELTTEYHNKIAMISTTNNPNILVGIILTY